MTYPGAPSIYYGDEIGMAGGHDPANRGAFPWHKPETWDTDLLHEFQRLIALRRPRPALRRGSFRFLHAQDEVIAYVRQLGDETVVVAINAARSPSPARPGARRESCRTARSSRRPGRIASVRGGAGDAARHGAGAAVGRRPGDAGRRDRS